MRFLVLALVLATASPAIADDNGAPSPSPAERRIESAKTLIQTQPDRFQAYNDLALGLISRARETGDSSCYEEAEKSIARSLQIQPHNFDGEQAHIALLLAERRYAEALAEAKALNHKTPDAVLLWGYISEADEALGDYDESARAAQWMLDLRPGNVPGLLRAAALREDWGDLEGSADLLSRALEETPAFESEQTAWILTSLARVNRMNAKLNAAESFLQRALASFPDYYAPIEELSRVRMAQHRDAEAIELIDKRNLHFPSPQSVYFLAATLEQAGRTEEAQTAFRQFEQTALAITDQPANSNRELILYYAGRGQKPAEALRVAQTEIARRHDLGTLDAYAWALYSNREYAEAQRQIERALTLGNREPDIAVHAAAIRKAAAEKGGADIGLGAQQAAVDPTP